MTNEELMTREEQIQKAIITTNDLASAGKLNTEQADQFIDFVIDVTELSGNVRVVRFRSESYDIDKIGVGNRVSVPKSEASAPSVRRGITHSKITLTPKEIMTPFEIGDNYIEINIEGESVVDHIIRMMATQTANDLEELAINGNTVGPARFEGDIFDGGSTTLVIKDSFMSLLNGWLKLADSGNTYDAEGEDINFSLFSRIINEMPNKFRRTRRDLRFLASMDHEQLYRESVASRSTNAGDVALDSQTPLRPFGIPLIGVPLLDAEPRIVEHITFGAGPDTQSLTYAPIGTSVIVTPTTLSSTPITPYVEGAGQDYTVDRVNGTVTALSGGNVESSTVKITYHSAGQILLTNFQNLVWGIGRDIRIERARDIYAGNHQFAITTKVDAQIEEVTAVVKGYNVGLS